VLGDAMAMPIGSMIEKFRPEFEAEIEAARARDENVLAAGPPSGASLLASPRGAS
jgi:NADH-quinone oxidoreductase subunit F